MGRLALTYREVVDRPTCRILLKCIKPHDIKFEDTRGRKQRRSFKKGAVHRRDSIRVLKPRSWELA